MIIISQDEENIVNFNNIIVLKFIDFTNSFGIKAYFNEKDYELLGIYKTKERAKEVLKEILDWIANKDGEDCKIFYMPKE